MAKRPWITVDDLTAFTEHDEVKNKSSVKITVSEWISEMFDESANLFDFVYVISHRFCLYYDTQAKSTEKHSLPQDESWLLATIGRMTAEGELSMTDEEWL